jgi:hypothetical protein
VHTLEPFTKENANEDDDQAMDKELERVNQQVQQLQKEKEKSFGEAGETRSGKRANRKNAKRN